MIQKVTAAFLILLIVTACRTSPSPTQDTCGQYDRAGQLGLEVSAAMARFEQARRHPDTGIDLASAAQTALTATDAYITALQELAGQSQDADMTVVLRRQISYLQAIRASLATAAMDPASYHPPAMPTDAMDPEDEMEYLCTLR